MCARKKLGLKNKKVPRMEVAVIFTVMLVSKFFNIAYGVFLGVAICAVNYSWKEAGQFEFSCTPSEEGKRCYRIDGPLFFAAANRLVTMLDPENDPDEVEVVFGHTSVMDYSAVVTLNVIAKNYKAKEKKIIFKSLNMSSQKLIQK